MHNVVEIDIKNDKIKGEYYNFYNVSIDIVELDDGKRVYSNISLMSDKKFSINNRSYTL